MRILIVVCAFALAAGSADAKSCKDPNTGKFVKCPTAAAAPGTPASASASPTAATAGKAPQCKTGKPCGNSCIAKDKVCHK